MYRIIILFILLILFIDTSSADYILTLSQRQKTKIDRMPKGIVYDMKRIPQDPSFYAKQIKPWPRYKQRRLDKVYNQKYFKPWHIQQLDLPATDFGWEIRFVRKKPIYRAKGSIIPSYTYERWIKNANYSALNSKRYKAITTKRTDVKALPTSEAYYRNPRRTGEGFPFDYNQNSALHINVPLFISHFSLDKRWAFVRASYSFGWVKTTDLALVNRSFMQSFENGHYAVTIKDNLRLYDEIHKPISFVKLGALFPMIENKKKKFYLVAKRTKRGKATLYKVRVQHPSLLATKPLRFTANNVAKVAKEFYNEPYGWGGSYECRDCSATTRDFLGVFGIFLRRNSSKQARDGMSINIPHWPKSYKKNFITQNAEPFRSLLYVPGHIVLYLGQYRGEPVIMHTYWGIRKKNGSKLITGRTIITSTEPGKERADVREHSKLIHTLRTIVNF